MPHPDSITPPAKDKILSNGNSRRIYSNANRNQNSNNGAKANENFMINPPEFGHGSKDKNENDDEEEPIDFQSQGDDGMDSMELQYTGSNKNGQVPDYLSSY